MNEWKESPWFAEWLKLARGEEEGAGEFVVCAPRSAEAKGKKGKESS